MHETRRKAQTRAIRVGWITTNRKFSESQLLSGGSTYELMAVKALRENFPVDLIHIRRQDANNIVGKTASYWSLANSVSRVSLEAEIVVRNPFSVAFGRYDGFTKNVAMIHQFNVEGWKHQLLAIRFFRNLRKLDAIVTVSRYWRDWFASRGYSNVRIIYNSFDLRDFEFSKEEIRDFRKKHNLMVDKPLVYIGNCQKEKGVVEVYAALKGLDTHLVSSGAKEVDIPVRTLTLGYRDYLLLLKCSSVVITMSRVREGWCRTAHEAMLYRTPVVGSGTGGMSELLSGGGQIICHNIEGLRGNVEMLLGNRELAHHIGDSGFDYAKKFTYSRFRKEWVGLINEIA